MIFKVWLKDGIFALKTFVQAFLRPSPPEEYIGKELKKCPVVVISGIMGKWNVFSKLMPLLVKQGHPVYTVNALKSNLFSIEDSAELVRKTIDNNNLKNVILVGHSKGGLIGKFILISKNNDKRVSKLIALATPFAGSIFAKGVPISVCRELAPGNKVLTEMSSHTEVNGKIVSIFSQYDNLVKPASSCVLEGAENIELNISGHHQILFNSEALNIIIKKLTNN